MLTVIISSTGFFAQLVRADYQSCLDTRGDAATCAAENPDTAPAAAPAAAPAPDTSAYDTCMNNYNNADYCSGQNPANTPGSSGDQGSGTDSGKPVQQDTTGSAANSASFQDNVNNVMYGGTLNNLYPTNTNLNGAGSVQQNKNGTTYSSQSGIVPVSNTGTSGAGASPGASSAVGLPLTTASTPSGTFTIKNPLKADSVSEIVQTAAQIFAYVVVLIGVLALIWTGLQYVLAQGNSEKLSKLKEQLLWIVVGIAIVIGARIIISVVINTLAASGVVNQNIINSVQDANK